MRRFGLLILLCLVAFVSAQPRGTVTIGGPVSGSPGTVVTLPVTLTLDSGTSIDGLSFAVKFVPIDAPACSPTSPACQISFTKAATLAPPSVVGACATEQPPCPDFDSVAVIWVGTLSLSSSSSPIPIGTVSFTIPATAASGQSYAVLVPVGSGFPSASNGSTNYQLAGSSTTVTVVGAPTIALSTNSLGFSVQQGFNPPSQNVSVSNSASGTLTWTASVGSGAFLSVSGGSGTGNGAFTVNVNSASLATGNYAGTILVSATGASNSPRTVNVSLAVTTDAPQPVLAVSPRTLNFAVVQGGANPAAQAVGIANTGTGTLSWTATVASGADFLTISTSAGSAPASLSVSVNAGGKVPGSYSGTVQIEASGATGSPQTIAVTLVVSAGPVLAVNAATLSFTGQTGQAINPQTVQITNSGAGTLNWTATTAVTVGAPNWLSVTPLSGAAPTTLTVAVNTLGLAAGTHQGIVTVASSGTIGSPQTINVTLTLSAANQPVLALSPRLIQFTTPAKASPLPQTFQVLNTGSNASNFSIQASTASGGNWLSVTPSSGTATATAPGNVLVQVNATALDPGNYAGTINVSSPNASNSPQALTVNLAVGAPTLNRNGLVNGASFSQTAVVSPGSIVSLFGVALAPGIAVANSLPLPTTLLGVQVLVNETAAPLFFVSPSQINFQMLSGLTDPTIQVVVISASVRSLPIDVPVVAEEPGLFTIAANGTGQAAVLNSDSSANGAGNPAVPNSFIQIFATGLGKTNPPVSPGQPAPADPLSLTVSKPVVRIAGTAAELLFSGLAPGFVGLYQINVRVPTELASGQQNLQLELNGRQSNLATVAIR